MLEDHNEYIVWVYLRIGAGYGMNAAQGAVGSAGKGRGGQGRVLHRGWLR